MKSFASDSLLRRATIVVRYKRYTFVGILLLLFPCSGCHVTQPNTPHTTPPKEYDTQYSGWGFSVQIPENMTVNSQTCLDFMLYSFVDPSTIEKKGLLFAYVGNHPDFGNVAPEKPQILMQVKFRSSLRKVVADVRHG